MDVDINNLEIVLLSEKDASNLTLETGILNTTKSHINTSKDCNSTCGSNMLFEDFRQCYLFEGL